MDWSYNELSISRGWYSPKDTQQTPHCPPVVVVEPRRVSFGGSKSAQSIFRVVSSVHIIPRDIEMVQGAFLAPCNSLRASLAFITNISWALSNAEARLVIEMISSQYHGTLIIKAWRPWSWSSKCMNYNELWSLMSANDEVIKDLTVRAAGTDQHQTCLISYQVSMNNWT